MSYTGILLSNIYFWESRDSVSFSDYQEIFWYVPILDDSDKRVLAKVGNLLNDSLQSIQAANFFSTVLLQDFPPQVFLYDTTILNVRNFMNLKSECTLLLYSFFNMVLKLKSLFFV